MANRVLDLSGPTPGSAYAGMSREDYERKIRERNQREAVGTSAEGIDTSASPGISEVGQKMGAQMASAQAQQGSGMGTLGGGLMMTGNPYAMAAGLGLQVLASGEQNRRAEEERERQAYNDRIAQRQAAMNNIAQMRL